jgi:26S proteasome regulatory subunit N5
MSFFSVIQKKFPSNKNQETEAFLSNLVVNKTIFARMDRPAGVITFTKPQDPTVMLNEWSNSIHSLLDLIVKTNHLITKEEMVHSLALDR